MATIHAIYPADDGLNCMRGIKNACLMIAAFILLGLLIATSVFPDDINPRKEYRMQLNMDALRAHGMEVPR